MGAKIVVSRLGCGRRVFGIASAPPIKPPQRGLTKKGLRDLNISTSTLSQNGYGVERCLEMVPELEPTPPEITVEVILSKYSRRSTSLRFRADVLRAAGAAACFAILSRRAREPTKVPTG